MDKTFCTPLWRNRRHVPHKDNPQCCTVSFAAAWRWYKGLVRQSPQKVSKARRRTFEAEDLFAHLVQIVDAGRRYSLCLGTRANGAHPSFESCLPQRWPTLLQILQIFGEQSTAQPGPIQLYRVQAWTILTRRTPPGPSRRSLAEICHVMKRFMA